MMHFKGKTTPAELNRKLKHARVEMFKALHQAHLYYKENEQLHAKNGELNVFLQERKTDGWGKHVIDVAMQHIEKQENEIDQLREALNVILEEEAQYCDEHETLIHATARKVLVGESIDT